MHITAEMGLCPQAGIHGPQLFAEGPTMDGISPWVH